MTFVGERAEKFDLGRIVSRTLGTIQGHLAAFYAWALFTAGLPVALVQILQVGATAHPVDGLSPVGAAFGAMALLGGLVSFVARTFCSCFLIAGALTALEGRRRPVGDQMKTGLAVILPVIGIQMLSGVAIAATSLLLIVPGFIVMCMLCVAVPAEVAERTGVIGALSRSADLTRGHRWSIFGALALYSVTIGLIGAIISLVIGLVFFGGVGKSYLTAEGTPLAYVGIILTAFVTAAYAVVGAVGVTALYAELRLVKEGPQTQSLGEVFA